LWTKAFDSWAPGSYNAPLISGDFSGDFSRESNTSTILRSGAIDRSVMMEHGRHIKVLGKGSPDALRSLAGVKEFLTDLVFSLGMRPLGDTHMYEVEEEIEKLGVEPFEDEGGVTGFCVLSTSHCAIHTWPLRGFFVMDVYSCRDFDAAVVRKLVAERLGVYQLRITDLTYSLSPDFDEAPATVELQA
jgi:S-adenosylmethionine decarboxylase